MQPSRELDEACAQLGATMLVLFGSHAPGGLPPRPDSDVDLALRFAPGAARPSRWRIFDALEPLFPGHELDLVMLADADPLLRWEIMERGVLLAGDIDAFHEYRAFAYRDFVDSADLRHSSSSSRTTSASPAVAGCASNEG
jgi:predicted nucleotidyltransferase